LKNRHRELLRLVQNSWLRLLGAMGCMLVIAASTSATAFLVKPVLDDIFFNKDILKLRLIPMAVLMIYFLRGLGYYGQEYLMNFVGESIIQKLRDRLYSHIQDLPLGFFQEEKTGVLMSRITNDVNIIKTMVSTAVTGSLRDCFTIMGLTFVIFYRDWQLAVCALIILPIAFFPIVKFGRRVRKISTGCQEAMADMNSFLHETIAGNKIVKAFNMEGHEKKRFAAMTRQLFRLEMKNVKAKALSSPVMEFLGGLGIAFVIWYGGASVISGKSTAGTFFSFMAAVLMLYGPVKKLAKLNNRIQQGMSAADRVFDLLELEADINVEHPEVLTGNSHAVEFRHVYLQYNAGMVLKDINIKAAPGEVIALVGMSGGGKTSLVNLIPRFFDVSRGHVSIDGLDIRQIGLTNLRDQIAIVTQDTILFNNTIRNNIAYGRPDALSEEIESAARAAYAYDFIMNLPQGFDTMIGELGGRLSGGEKQRVCIARALIKDAPILILDEATSALDTESELLVQKALENLMKGRTTFVIAHRLSTISYAHRIIVLVNGHIVEEGRHEELLIRRGTYHKLHQMQFNKSN